MDNKNKIYILIISIILVVLVAILIVRTLNKSSLNVAEDVSSNETENFENTYIEPVTFKRENIISKITDINQIECKYKKYNEILSSNNYYLHCKGYITNQDENEVTSDYILARNDTSYGIICKDLDYAYILNDNNLNVISYSNQTVTVQTPEISELNNLKNSFILDTKDDNLRESFEEGGLINIDGVTYDYEKYKITNTIQEIYYFLDNELKYIKTIDAEADFGTDKILQIYELSNTVKDNILDIPSNYKKIQENN